MEGQGYIPEGRVTDEHMIAEAFFEDDEMIKITNPYGQNGGNIEIFQVLYSHITIAESFQPNGPDKTFQVVKRKTAPFSDQCRVAVF